MTTAPGWYPDPAGKGTRWWDGNQWTDPPAPEPTKTSKFPRIFFWVFLLIQLLFIAWIIYGSANATSNQDCGTLDKETCDTATGVGLMAGIGMILCLWAVVDVILGISYAVYHLHRRAK